MRQQNLLRCDNTAVASFASFASRSLPVKPRVAAAMPSVLQCSVVHAPHAQQPTPASMGTVPTHDALVTGGLEVRGDTARLLTNTSVTAYDHSAAISLARGGEVLVCATSQFHLLHSGTENSLLFGLDRGAIELHTDSSPQDVILTPDIRFTLEHPGHYDLRLRVTPNGDTCVENPAPPPPSSRSPTPSPAPPTASSPASTSSSSTAASTRSSTTSAAPAAARPPRHRPSSRSPPLPTRSRPAHHPHRRRRRTPLPSRCQPGPRTHAPSPAHDADARRPAADPGLYRLHLRRRPPQHPAAQHRRAPEAPPTPAQTSCRPGSPHRHRRYNASATPPPTPPGAHDLFHAIGHLFHKLFHPHSNPPFLSRTLLAVILSRRRRISVFRATSRGSSPHHLQ